MSVEHRVGLIRLIEGLRGSRIVSYLTGDRGGPPGGAGLQTSIGMDIFPFFYDVLGKMGKQSQIDLLIYSTGGATMAAWGLVNLLREFGDKLRVLIPFKALSRRNVDCSGGGRDHHEQNGTTEPR